MDEPSSKRVSKPSKSRSDQREERDDGREPGSSILPVARVQKIIKADADIQACSKEAVFLIGIATEFFIKRFADQSYLKARLDHRKLVQLKDMAQAVQTVPEFTFLEDMIPIPLPLSQALAARAAKVISDDLPPQDEELAALRLHDLPTFAKPGAEGMEGAMVARPKNKARPKKSAGAAGEGEGGGEDGGVEGGGESAGPSKPPQPSSRPSRRSGPPDPTPAAADGGDSDLEEEEESAMQVDDA